MGLSDLSWRHGIDRCLHTKKITTQKMVLKNAAGTQPAAFLYSFSKQLYEALIVFYQAFSYNFYGGKKL